MKLTKKELVAIAELLHGTDHYCECDALVEPYSELMRRYNAFHSVKLEKETKEIQMLLLVQFWCQNYRNGEWIG